METALLVVKVLNALHPLYRSIQKARAAAGQPLDSDITAEEIMAIRRGDTDEEIARGEAGL